jgi:hypothetical protein
MSFMIGNNVVRGEIDNRKKGKVTGRIWLAGRKNPLRLELRGDCLNDIAGCCLLFECMDAKQEDVCNSLSELQEGGVGDMTASMRVKMEVSGDDPGKSSDFAAKPGLARVDNILYLEWFSKSDGRVVIDTNAFRINEISKRSWRPVPSQDGEDFSDEPFAGVYGKLAEDDSSFFDEFEWEKILRDSDSNQQGMLDIMEEFADYPDFDEIMARKLGWLEPRDAGYQEVDVELDLDDDEFFFNDDDDSTDIDQEYINGEEGLDWVRADDGSVEHPLAARSTAFVEKLHRDFKKLGMLPDDNVTNQSLVDLVSNLVLLAGKLGIALNMVIYGDDPVPGFIVANLKRSLVCFDGAMKSIAEFEGSNPDSKELVQSWRAELFSIREEILDLMDKYRAMI